MNATATGLLPAQQRKGFPRPKQFAEAYLSLLLFMVVYCARPEDWIPGISSVPLAKITGLLALIAFALSLGHIRQRLPQEIILVIVLIGHLFLTVPMSPVWIGGALNTTLDFAKVGLIVLVLVVAVNTASRLRRLLFIQAASVATISAVAVWKGHMVGGRLEGMLGGNYSNPNDLALAIVVSLPICLALLFLSASVWSKAAWALAMVVMVYAVFLTGSRGGFISLAVAAGVCLWGFAVRGRRPYLLVLAAIVAVGLWIFASGMTGDRLRGTFDSKNDAASAYGSAQERQELFWRSVAVTAKHPLFGVGPGNFQVMSGSWHETHNAYTQLSSEGGLPALILFVMILWRGFRNLRATQRLAGRTSEHRLLAQALQASLVGFVVGSLFASVAFQFFPYFLVAYTRALLRITKESAARSKATESVRQMVPVAEMYAERAQSELSWRSC
jgi:putative inorganic carbon (HCO3(-)) transporter